MKLKEKLLFTLVSWLLISSIATAGDAGTQLMHKGHPGFSVGVFRATQGEEQHINIQTLVGNNVTVTKSNDQNVLLGLGYLLDGGVHGRFNLAYGIDAFYIAKTNVQGVVTQEDVCANLSYQYSTTNIPIYVIAKAAIKNANDKYALTLDVGLGPNIMRTYNYFATSLDDGVTIPDNAFLGRRSTVFSATAGVGIPFNNVPGSSLVELGYRFFCLGQGEFATRTNQILNSLKTGNSYANALVLTIST